MKRKRNSGNEGLKGRDGETTQSDFFGLFCQISLIHLTDFKQLLDEVFVISGIIKVEGRCYQPQPSADNTY